MCVWVSEMKTSRWVFIWDVKILESTSRGDAASGRTLPQNVPHYDTISSYEIFITHTRILHFVQRKKEKAQKKGQYSSNNSYNLICERACIKLHTYGMDSDWISFANAAASRLRLLGVLHYVFEWTIRTRKDSILILVKRSTLSPNLNVKI